MEFKKPPHGDALTVTASIKEHSRATLSFNQVVIVTGVAGELLVNGDIRVACLDAETYRPRGLPRELIEKLASFAGNK